MMGVAPLGASARASAWRPWQRRSGAGATASARGLKLYNLIASHNRRSRPIWVPNMNSSPRGLYALQAVLIAARGSLPGGSAGASQRH